MGMATDAGQPIVQNDGLEHKTAGNDHLKAGRIEEAIGSYALALEASLALEDRAAVFANRALANLRMKRYKGCETDCSEALKLQPRYVKAFYRRAMAREAQGKLADSFKDVREVLRLEPTNREAQALASKLKVAIEMRAATSDLSTPSLAVEALRAATGDEDRVQAVGKLSRIGEDSSRAAELLHAGAIPPLAALLPATEQLQSAADLQMPLVGLVVEALERMSVSANTDVLRAIVAAPGTVPRLAAVLRAAAEARSSLPVEEGAAEAAQLKNCLTTAHRALTLLAFLASSRAAVGSQSEQARLVRLVLPYARHAEEGVQKAALDALLRVAEADATACAPALPDALRTLIWLVGDEDAPTYRVSIAILSRLFAKAGSDEDNSSNTPGLCSACEAVLSPILRDSSADWDAHAAAVHGVTAVLAINKEVGAWLLRQESIFWSLAEVVEVEDEDLHRSLAEIYAHAANDVAHFREQAGEEPIKHLKQMLKSNKPKVRARACVALAKVALMHQMHRPTINPSGKLLSATLGLLEAKVPPSVHRWAVEALMFLSVMPDVKEHLAEKGVRFGSLVSLSESVGKDSSFHFALISAFRRLCVAREKPDDQKRLEQEMDPAQIEQMRQLAAGGQGAGPAERADEPEVLAKLAATLVEDDAVLVLSELVAHAPADSVSLRRSAAQVLLSMAQTQGCRGKIVQQGGFKALCSLVLSADGKTETAAAWALAKVGISINPVMYPRRLGSGPETMVKPILRLIDTAENELQQFEGCMALCNLATVAELRERVLDGGGWRTLTMAMACDNELVQRSAIEAMSNLASSDQVIEKFLDPASTEVKIFVGFCGADDPKAQLAASGALATLASVPEVGAALIAARAVEAFVDIALLAETADLLHRAAVGLENFFCANTELMVGPAGGAVPDHALPALGALMVLSKSAAEPVKKSALTAIVRLNRERPDVGLPPPDAVAAIVQRIKEEDALRRAQAEAEEELAEEQAPAAASAEAEGEGPLIEEVGTVV